MTSLTDTERLHRQDEADIVDVMRTPAGMRFIAYLVDISGANQQCFAGDANAAVFADGRRSVGLQLLARIHAKGTDEAGYLQAVVERNELRRKDAAELEKLQKGADEYGASGQWSPESGRDE